MDIAPISVPLEIPPPVVESQISDTEQPKEKRLTTTLDSLLSEIDQYNTSDTNDSGFSIKINLLNFRPQTSGL